MQKTKPFPVDYDSLKKGDFIPAERCEQILETNRSDRHYMLKLLGLKERILDEMADRGINLTIKFDHDGIRILTDSEAAEYNPGRFRAGVRTMARSHRASMLIDRGNLTDEERKQLDRTVEVQGRMLQAMHKSRENLEPLPHKKIE